MATTPNALKTIFSRNAIGFIMLAYALIFLLVKSPNDPYDRLIINDGKGYYAYLPALFIYQDLEYGFVEYYESKYYPSDADPSYFKEFRFKYRGQTVNKTFSGIAVLMLPFFLIAHVLALLFGEADGYSMIYQYAIGFSAYFYLWLGLVSLSKLLRHFSENKQFNSLILLAIALGTNILYYVIVEGTMPHVYLFFLVNSFLLLSLRAIREREPVFFIGAASVLGLILITRPQNGFIIFALPFLAGNYKEFTMAVSFLVRRKVLLLKSMMILISVIMLQVTLWYAQTGYLLVYSYGDETFNFLNPQLVNLLWSYEKGWMVYTPLAFISFAGLISLFRTNPYRAAFILLTFLILAWVMSSWWVWHYTSQFGQRVFIDFSALLALLLLFGFSLFQKRSWRIAYGSTIVLLIGLNLFQFYQHLVWVYPTGPVTSRTYWQNFFRVRPQAAVLIPEEYIIERHKFSFPVKLTGEETFEQDDLSLRSHQLMPYRVSPLFSLAYGGYPNNGQMILRVNTKVWGCADSTLNLQFDFFTSGKKYSEQLVSISRFLRCEKPNTIEAALFMPFSLDVNDSVRVSMQSPAAFEITTGESSAEIFVVSEEADLRWIVQPLNSVASTKRFYNKLEENEEFFNLTGLSNEKALSGEFSTKIGSSNPFGLGFKINADNVFNGGNRLMRIRANTYAEKYIESARLVISLMHENQHVFYKAFPLASETIHDWQSLNTIVELPRFPGFEPEIRVYFWDTDPSEPWFIDDVCLEFITLTDRWMKTTPSGSFKETQFETFINLTDTVRMDQRRVFYGLQHIELNELTNCSSSSVYFEAMVMSDYWFPAASLVAAHYSGESLIDYQSRSLTSYILKGQWSKVFFEIPVQSCVSESDYLHIYFWNPSKDEVLMVADFTVFKPIN